MLDGQLCLSILTIIALVNDDREVIFEVNFKPFVLCTNAFGE